jgi:Concanavalin A-like lectin/glucanases superfamily
MNRTRQMLSASALVLAALLQGGAPPAGAASKVALWHMNAVAGPMIDASGSGNNGTLEAIRRVSPGYNGRGRAYRFNGTNARVIVGNDASLNPGTRNITLTAHVKTSVQPPPSVGDYDVVRKGSGIYKMEIMGSGRASCRFEGSSGGVSIEAGPNVANGRWHAITCWKTSSRIRLTVDGASWSVSGRAGAISSGSSLVLGGKPNASGDWYRGVMDEVSIAIG